MAEPSSEPLTPTRMAGAANTFQFEDRGEDRGDLIKFYNSVRISPTLLIILIPICIYLATSCTPAVYMMWPSSGQFFDAEST